MILALLSSALDLALYEEVEAFNGMRPVLVFGALADHITSALLESYPNLFYRCDTGESPDCARVWLAALLAVLECG